MGILLHQRCSPSYMCWWVFYFNNTAHLVICVGGYFIHTWNTYLAWSDHVTKIAYGWFIVFNASFNHFSVISWRSVLLVEETGVHGENHQPSHNVVSITDLLSEGMFGTIYLRSHVNDVNQYGCFESCQFRPRSVFFVSWRLKKLAGDFRCLRYYCNNVSIS